MRHEDKEHIRRMHPYAWLWEPLEDDVTFVLRAMFGTKAVYLNGRLVLCFSAREPPWSGVLVATDKERHPSLIAEFPSLTPHPILPKWLYLEDSADEFEGITERLVQLAKRRDPRIGVTPQPKKRRKRA
jgi:hypothetical protein